MLGLCNEFLYFILLVRSQSMERTLEAPTLLPTHTVNELEWILSPEQSANTSIREEFRFEQVSPVFIFVHFSPKKT